MQQNLLGLGHIDDATFSFWITMRSVFIWLSSHDKLSATIQKLSWSLFLPTNNWFPLTKIPVIQILIQNHRNYFKNWSGLVVEVLKGNLHHWNRKALFQNDQSIETHRYRYFRQWIQVEDFWFQYYYDKSEKCKWQSYLEIQLS